MTYSYLGLNRSIRASYVQPGLELTYIKQGAEATGDAGDQYTGLDRFGRVVDQRWLKTSDGSSLERVKYGFDRASNRLWRENSGASSQDFIHAYDGLNRLTRFRRGNLNATYDDLSSLSFEQQWSLDPTDNWSNLKQDDDGNGTWDLDQNRTHNTANELAQIAGASTYIAEDLVGNITKAPKTNNWSAAWDFTYDAWNRLVKIMDGAVTVNLHKYDGLNRRIVRTAGSVDRHYYYSDQWQILEERKATNTYSERQFVWGIRYVDDLVFRDRDADGDGSHTLEERLYVLNDFFNVTALTDTSATVQERYRYDAYGVPTVMTGSFGARADTIYDWETWYGGYRMDRETALYQVRNRYLHPKLGRWLTRDSVEYEDGNNLYRYAKNSPINYVDPTGNLIFNPAFDLAALLAALIAAVGICLALALLKAIIDALSKGVRRPSPRDPRTGDCTAEQQAALQAAVNAACKSGKRACLGSQDCDTLKENLAKNLACAAARDAINMICYGGGDPGHKQAANEARRAAEKCAIFIAAKC